MESRTSPEKPLYLSHEGEGCGAKGMGDGAGEGRGGKGVGEERWGRARIVDIGKSCGKKFFPSLFFSFSSSSSFSFSPSTPCLTPILLKR
jgi:hypothetical protein